MKKPINIHSSYALVAGIIILIMLCTYGIHMGEEKTCTKIQSIFQEAISKDCHNRLNDEPHFHNPFNGEKVKRVSIITENGKEFIDLEDSLDAHIAYQQMFQHALLEDNPLQPDVFNALLKETLEESGISTKASGVIYQYKGRKQYSNNDSTSMQSAFLTQAETIDIKKQATVQAWVKYDFMSMLRNMPKMWAAGIVAYFALFIGASIHVWRNKISRKQADHEKELLGNTIKIGDMALYERTRTIHTKNLSRQLSKNEFRLLWMFASAPEHTLDMQDIQDEFWFQNVNAQQNMYVLINQLKKVLEDFPEYQIVVMKKQQKYQLIFAF